MKFFPPNEPFKVPKKIKVKPDPDTVYEYIEYIEKCAEIFNVLRKVEKPSIENDNLGRAVLEYFSLASATLRGCL